MKRRSVRLVLPLALAVVGAVVGLVASGGGSSKPVDATAALAAVRSSKLPRDMYPVLLPTRPGISKEIVARYGPAHEIHGLRVRADVRHIGAVDEVTLRESRYGQQLHWWRWHVRDSHVVYEGEGGGPPFVLNGT